METFITHSALSKAQKLIAGSAIMALLAASFLALLSVDPQSGFAARTQCSDGIDNDADGKADFPEDDDCEDLDDDFEGYSRSGLFLSVTDDKEVIDPTGSVVYRITLKQQRDTERLTTVSFILPHQADLISASDGGSVSPDGRVTWTNVPIYKDVTRVLTVNASIKPNAEHDTLAIARVIADGEQDTDTTRVEAVKEIQGRFFLSLSDGENYVQPGEKLYYKLRVRNSKNTTETTEVRVSLPRNANFLNASTGGERTQDDNIVWKNITFTPGEERNFTFAVEVEGRIVDGIQLRTRAIAGGSQIVDETVVRRGLPYASVESTISDGRQTVARGQLLTYFIEMTNTADVLGTEEYVTASLPVYSEFVDATEGGYWDGKNVRWNNIQIAPNGVRRLSYTIRVRSDAEIGGELLATVQTEGGYNTDHTTVEKFSNETPSPFGGVNPSVSTRTASNLLLRKVASNDEAVPGGQIRYTIYIQNTLPHVIGNATVSDRFDSAYLSFVSAENGGGVVNGEMQWNVPVLQPGQAWQTSYVLAVSPNAPQGHVLTNIATLAGADVQAIPLTERVRTVHTGVLTALPTTGAAMDVIAIMLTTLLGIGTGGAVQLRRLFLV